MIITEKLIKEFLKDQEYAWAASTRRSVQFALMGVASHLDGDPRKLFTYLTEHSAPYTRVTTWSRVTQLWQWCIDHGKIGATDVKRNPYSDFRRRYARSFKNVYVRKPTRLSLREARARVAQIGDAEDRAKALELLQTGMRYAESFTLKDGYVIGKGGKVREIIGWQSEDRPVAYQKHYNTFRRNLKKAGLKPHELRKVFANHLVRKANFETFDLCETMGWDSLETAKSYVAPARRETLRERVRKAVPDNGDENT